MFGLDTLSSKHKILQVRHFVSNFQLFDAAKIALLFDSAKFLM